MFLMTAILAMSLSASATTAVADVQMTTQPELAEPAQARPSSPPAPKAQDPKEQKTEAKEPPTPPHTGIRALFENLVEDVKHLPSKQNVYLAASGGGLAIAAHPFDQTLNARMVSHYDAVN